jgi:AsmA family protein
MRLVSQSKKFSLASPRGPIVVSGTFKKPSVQPDMGKVMARSSLAVGLGVLTGGVGALLPLLEFGRDKDSNCAALMNQARSDAGIKQSDIKPR